MGGRWVKQIRRFLRRNRPGDEAVNRYLVDRNVRRSSGRSSRGPLRPLRPPLCPRMPMIPRLVSGCIVAGSAMLIACSDAGEGVQVNTGRLRNPPASFDHAATGATPLRGEPLGDAEFLGIPNQLAVVGPYLLTADMASESFLHLVEPNTGQRLASFGRGGGGPGEYYSVPRLVDTPSPTDSAIWAYDLSQARLTRYDFRDVAGEQFDGRVSTRLRAPATVYELLLVSDTSALGLGFFPGGRLGYFDLPRGRFALRGAMPVQSDAPPSVLQHAYQGRLVSDPARTRVAVATVRGSQIEIYGRNGILLTKVNGPYPFEVDFDVKGGRNKPQFSAGRLNRYGYVDLDATDAHVYALFSGRSEEAFRRDAGLAEYIHIFDWQGRFIKAYHLDRAVTEIALDPGRSLIYAVTRDPEPALLRFRVPPVQVAHTGG